MVLVTQTITYPLYRGGSLWSYAYNLISGNSNSIIGGIMDVNERSTKAMTADIIKTFGGSFYDLDVELTAELYNNSQDFSNYPKYLQAVKDYFAIDENKEFLSNLVDEIILNELL